MEQSFICINRTNKNHSMLVKLSCPLKFYFFKKKVNMEKIEKY